MLVRRSSISTGESVASLVIHPSYLPIFHTITKLVASSQVLSSLQCIIDCFASSPVLQSRRFTSKLASLSQNTIFAAFQIKDYVTASRQFYPSESESIVSDITTHHLRFVVRRSAGSKTKRPGKLNVSNSPIHRRILLSGLLIKANSSVTSRALWIIIETTTKI